MKEQVRSFFEHKNNLSWHLNLRPDAALADVASSLQHCSTWVNGIVGWNVDWVTMVTSNHWFVKDGRLCYFLASRSESLAKKIAPTKPSLQISFGKKCCFFGKIVLPVREKNTLLNFVHFGKILLVRLIPRNHFPKPAVYAKNNWRNQFCKNK